MADETTGGLDRPIAEDRFDVERGDILIRRYYRDSFEVFSRDVPGAVVSLTVHQVADLAEAIEELWQRLVAEKAQRIAGGRDPAAHG